MTSRKFAIRATALVACCAAALACAACGARRGETAPVHLADLAALSSIQPDVQVLVLRDMSGQEFVDLTYPRLIPASQARQDVAAISQGVGIPSSDVEISNAALPLAGVKTAPMTSATFETAGALRSDATTLRIEPWIVALRGYQDVSITYMMPPQFQFNGLRSYQDGKVQIVLDRNDQSFTYHVHVLNSNFDRLGLPLMQPDPAALRFAEAQQRRRFALRVLGLLAVSAVAAGAGYSVYILLSRLH